MMKTKPSPYKEKNKNAVPVPSWPKRLETSSDHLGITSPKKDDPQPKTLSEVLNPNLKVPNLKLSDTDKT